jgi:MFS transporter, YNFM family, putative membrane transport protein
MPLQNSQTAAPSVPLDRTMVAVMMAGMCTFFNVYSTQPLLPSFRKLFQASELEVSVTVSATIFAVALMGPFVGALAERKGRKKVIVPSLVLLTVATFLCGTANSLRTLIAWRFVQGLCVPGVVAVILAYINEEWEGRGVGRAMASYVTGTVLGGFLGRFVSGLVATHWGWRWSFVVLGTMNLACTIMVRAWLPLAKRFVRAEHLSHVISDAKRHLRNRRLLANFGTGGAVLFSLVGCFTYANFYLAAPPFHLNSAQLGSIFFVYLLGVVVTPFSGKFLDHFGFRPTAFLYCGMMITGLLLTLVRSLPVVIAGLAVFSSGVFIAQAAATVQTGAIAGRARSSAAGLYVTVYYLGGAAGATITDWFWQRWGWPGCAAFLGIGAVVSLTLAMLSSWPHEVLPHAEPEVVGD